MNKYSFDFVDIKNIYNNELTVIIGDKSNIKESFIIPKLEDIINLVIKKDLEVDDIKYCVYDINKLKDKFNLLDKNIEHNIFIYINKTKDLIYL
jgi:hypothetical protein